MVRRSWWVLAALAFTGATEAQGIHKCAGPAGITYQSAPCASPDQEQAYVSAAKSAKPGDAPSTVANSARQRDAPTTLRHRQRSRYAGTPFAAKALAVGMSDTQVLNLPGWGRPDRIQRTRSKHAWREQWTYQGARSDNQLLYFENGRLVSREEPPPQWIQAQAEE